MSVSLIYVHDPMCSWCYGFSRTHDAIMKDVAGKVPVRRLLGGLAPDTEEPMPEAMKEKLRQTWQRIEQEIPGTEFNYEFWESCKPRRATYPACRALIAAKQQGEEFDVAMTEAIQQAYYRQARNPSDHDTLVALAEEIGLDADKFDADLKSESVDQQLEDEIKLSRAIGINSYPALAAISTRAVRHIDLDYTSPDIMLGQIYKAVQELQDASKKWFETKTPDTGGEVSTEN